MVWRAAVDGEARILLWGASAGVYRGFFCLPQRCALSGGLAARGHAVPLPLDSGTLWTGSVTTSSALSRRVLRISCRAVLDLASGV